MTSVVEVKASAWIVSDESLWITRWWKTKGRMSDCLVSSIFSNQSLVDNIPLLPPFAHFNCPPRLKSARIMMFDHPSTLSPQLSSPFLESGHKCHGHHLQISLQDKRQKIHLHPALIPFMQEILPAGPLSIYTLYHLTQPNLITQPNPEYTTQPNPNYTT